MNRFEILQAAHRIGRECCEFWLDYTDQPGVSRDPSDWELSALDVETACAELGASADDSETLEALRNGFSERRGELSQAIEEAHAWMRNVKRLCGVRS